MDTMIDVFLIIVIHGRTQKPNESIMYSIPWHSYIMLWFKWYHVLGYHKRCMPRYICTGTCIMISTISLVILANKSCPYPCISGGGGGEGPISHTFYGGLLTGSWRPSYSPVNIWYDLKQIATDFFSLGMHSGEVSLKHTKNPLSHLSGKQVKSAIKVTFSH